MKKCIKCKKEKEENLFPIGKNSCKECIAIYNKKYWKKYKNDNKESIKTYQNQYRIDNVEERRTYQKEYRQSNKKKIKEQRKYRYSTDEIYKFKIYMRKLINRSIRNTLGLKKIEELENILGISIIEFKIYLKSKFKQNMTWENYGIWEIDHIIPLSTANTKEEVLELCNYKNLQPLWIRENQLKSSKLM